MNFWRGRCGVGNGLEPWAHFAGLTPTPKFSGLPLGALGGGEVAGVERRRLPTGPRNLIVLVKQSGGIGWRC